MVITLVVSYKVTMQERVVYFCKVDSVAAVIVGRVLNEVDNQHDSIPHYTINWVFTFGTMDSITSTIKIETNWIMGSICDEKVMEDFAFV